MQISMLKMWILIDINFDVAAQSVSGISILNALLSIVGNRYEKYAKMRITIICLKHRCSIILDVKHKVKTFSFFREKSLLRQPCLFHCSWRLVAIGLTVLTLLLSSVIVYFGGMTVLL